VLDLHIHHVWDIQSLVYLYSVCFNQSKDACPSIFPGFNLLSKYKYVTRCIITAGHEPCNVSEELVDVLTHVT